MIRPPPDLLFSLPLGQYRCSLICRVKIALRPPHWQRLEPHKPLARCLTLQKPASRQENAQNKGVQTLRHFVRLNPNAHSRYGYDLEILANRRWAHAYRGPPLATAPNRPHTPP